MSLLHRASRAGHLTVVDTLLQAGADVNLQETRGKSPLHEASRTGSARVVSILLSHGANLNAKDSRGRTPLHYAANFEVGRVLLGAGANPNIRDNRGQQPNITVGARAAWYAFSSSASGIREAVWLRPNDDAYSARPGARGDARGQSSHDAVVGSVEKRRRERPFKEGVIARHRFRRECSSSERSFRSSSGERILPGTIPLHFKSTGGSPRKVRVGSTRKGRDRLDRKKSSSWAGETEFHPRHSSKGQQSSSSADSSGFLQEEVNFFESDDETGEKRDQHDDVRSCRASRRRRCSPSASSNSNSNGNGNRAINMNRHSLSAADAEWIIGHRLVRSIRAALESSGKDSPTGPRERSPAETDTLPSTQQSTPRPEYDPAQAGDARARALELGVGFGKLNDSVVNPAVSVGEAGHNAEEAGGVELDGAAAHLPGRLAHDRCSTRLESVTGNGARRETNEGEREALTRTRRSYRARHREAHVSGCGVPLANGFRDLTKAEMLIARQLLLAVRATICEGTRRSLVGDGPPFSGECTDQETTARDTEHLPVANGEEVSEPNHVATLREKAGDDDSSENKEGRNSVAEHAVGYCEAGAGVGAEQGRLGAEGRIVHPDFLDTENARSGSPDKVKGSRITPAQPVCTDAGSGGAAGPVARVYPRKTIAEQVDEVSARLDRIFVLPLN